MAFKEVLVYTGNLQEMGHLVASAGKATNTQNTFGNSQVIYFSDNAMGGCIEWNGQNGGSPGVNLKFDFAFDLKELLIYTDEASGNSIDVFATV